MKTIAIAGTFDSKGKEFLFLKHALEEFGLQTLMIHTGVFEPAFEPDVSNREVAAAVGEDIDAIAEKKDITDEIKNNIMSGLKKSLTV